MPNMDIRIKRLLFDLIERYTLNLDKLTILTEIATGPYAYSPLIAALASARKVYAIAKNSKFGDANTIIESGRRLSEELKLSSRIRFIRRKSKQYLEQCDIITNTGFVRPIRPEHIAILKNTAVIPLMWETWEYRKEDLDLNECRKKGILVLGTNEHEEPCNMAPYSGLLSLKLLFELNIEIYQNRILLLGDQPTLGESIYNALISMGAQVIWFGNNKTKAAKYDTLKTYFLDNGHAIDAILVAEHSDHRLLIGKNGLLSVNELEKINPGIRIGLIAGNVDAEQLSNSNLIYEPKNVKPAGYMHYQPDCLGPRPVLELTTAGLKVGQAMADARLSGLTVQEAVKYALKHSPAMDFIGDKSWLLNQT